MLCETCQSDSYLVVHGIESTPFHGGELLVEVTYTCTACDTLQSRLAPFRSVAARVNTTYPLGALLSFGDTYLHHGKPMAEVPVEVRRSIRERGLPGEPGNELLDVRLTTKMIRCECGFQLELPA
ncbi:hypothetical protein AB0N65_06660 [Paenarthrobacter sp. NPDC089322]|uniref:hypothetical protein n=1 Tax=Paenarthrobacter sp. NPDC089322 TaxID=3155065 RepID=UPI003424DDDD